METGRDRRPVVVAVAVVAVLLAALLLTSGSEPAGEEEAAGETSTSTTRPPTTRRDRTSTTRRSTTTTIPPPIADEPIGARLALAREGSLLLVDIDANAWTAWKAEELVPLNQQLPMVRPSLARRGDHLVFQGPDGTYATPLPEPGPPRLLSPSALFIPALDEREVWVVHPPDGRPAAVQRWRVDGEAVTAPRELPLDWVPLAAVEGGLVLRRGDRFQVWDPADGTTSWASDTSVNVVAAGGRLVAWHVHCEAPLCTLHLSDSVTGADRPVFVGNVQIDWGGGSFSPDGAHLVLHAHQVESAHLWHQGLLVVDVATGSSQFLPSPRQDLGVASASWSPDGRWLFLLPNTGEMNNDLLAYSPARQALIELRLPREARGTAVVAY